MGKQVITGRQILADLAEAMGLDMPVRRIMLDVSFDGVLEASVDFNVEANRAGAIVEAIRKHRQAEGGADS